MDFTWKITEEKMSHEESLEFNEYFLSKRLARVPIHILEKFVSTWKDTKYIANQKKLISEIIIQWKIMKNSQEFICEFKNFLRDFVLSARESEYLLRIEDKERVLEWLRSIKKENEGFSGQRYNFFLHCFIDFEEKYLEEIQEDKSNPILFPKEVVILIAVSKNPKNISHGLTVLNYYPTSEFEIIFRGDINLIEVRGEFQVIRDFVNTAILNRENPLSQVKSIFVGDKNETRANTSLVQPARFINIKILKDSINGAYLSASSIVAGSKTSRVTCEFDSLNNSAEETDIILRDVGEKAIKDSDKTKIQFKYKGEFYKFGITKTGGLTFNKYTPEEVVTYIFKKLRDLSRSEKNEK